MRRTPPLPDWITGFALGGYTNAHQLCPGTRELYVTERLREHYGVEAGDWDAPVLLLAKDAAPTDLIRDRIARGESMPWRPSSKQMGDRGGVRTNNAIAARIRSLGCNVLYGSALANLMSDQPEMSRSLKGFYQEPLKSHLQLALRWVIDQMPNLRVIACLGVEAWFVTSHVLGNAAIAKQCREYRDGERAQSGRVGGRLIAATAHRHPSRGSKPQLAQGWTEFSRQLSNSATMAA